MAQPQPTEAGSLQDLYLALSNLFDKHVVPIGDHLQTGMAQTLSEISSLKHETEAGRSSLESRIESLANILNATKSLANHVEPTSHRQNEHTEHSIAAYASLEQRCNTFRDESERLATENEQLTQRLEAEQQRVRDLEMNQQLWKAKLSRLQAVITKAATNANEVIDSEVTAKVQRIRARIETIVKKYCVGSRAAPRREHKELEEIDNDWVRKLKQIPTRYEQSDQDVFLTYWVRSKVYLLLQRRIFSQPCFGLDKDLESKLGEFETLISKYAHGTHPVEASKVPYFDTDGTDLETLGKNTSDWRALTLGYCKALGMTNDDTPKNVSQYIAHLFAPWVIGRPENQVGQKPVAYRWPPQLLHDLADLCRDAYDLTVMIRQSTDRYRFISIDEDSKVQSADQNDFQPDDMLGPTDKYVGSKVWMTVFGALIKETQAGERYVMEKARVICKAAPPLADHPKE
ncbi:hypothetical protein G647_08529 [Cladophialophora carrionii CBS 160.54]|uniref:Uncharacterized protein n=1 Tax=Cladophialophora carrionii CBS 160.54 TaxID=1279043 RepID=V9D3B7_9EURO|nr:uncharacterized protein G647_08529 [Cladophialophora carrionii CBS 160.54]ETI20492.1 hypothetical protein G647_08529 [Cladophialophora carrionii CBS 160.54]